MLTAENITGDLWLVTDDETGVQRKVAVRSGGTASDAIAALEEVMATPNPEDQAARDAAERLALARAECSRRIFAMCDYTAQINLAAVCAAGLMDAPTLAVYQSGLQWVADMRATWEPLAATTDDIYDDANWPAIPAGVAELAALF